MSNKIKITLTMAASSIIVAIVSSNYTPNKIIKSNWTPINSSQLFLLDILFYQFASF